MVEATNVLPRFAGSVNHGLTRSLTIASWYSGVAETAGSLKFNPSFFATCFLIPFVKGSISITFGFIFEYVVLPAVGPIHIICAFPLNEGFLTPFANCQLPCLNGVLIIPLYPISALSIANNIC